MRKFYTITAYDISQSVLTIFGRAWRTSDWIGRILARDVGKRVYLVGDTLQVENDEQFKARTDEAA